MIPTLLQIGPFPIRSYGVMIALSFAIGIWLAVRRGRKRGVDPGRITDLSIVILIASIVGARLLYVLPYWGEFAANPLRVFEIWRGGLTMYGGLAGAVLASALYMRAKRMPFWKVADIVAPSVALGLSLTRVGCFLNGCCFGVPNPSGWGVRFPPHSAAGSEFYGVPLHPAQLYDSAVGLFLFLLLLLLDGKLRRDGRLFLVFIGLYGVARFFLDRVRYYEDVSTVAVGGGFVFTWNQLLSVGLLVAALLLFFFGGGKRHDRR
ncbi:MAG: prolipoprotein diacylglyceryl transferase [Candidatus Latescibacterota bacterium]|nr:MAG: prolipoprotein diacylglyceryl transferase [Candidatus Latescibacterota bacterium]